VSFAGLNFFDLLVIENKYQAKPPLPFFAGPRSFRGASPRSALVRTDSKWAIACSVIPALAAPAK